MSKRYEPRQKRVLLCGYFGYGNMGDEAALRALVGYLTAGGISVTVAAHPSGDPAEYEALGAVVCDRLSPYSMHRAMDGCDAVVFAGGNHFENESSRRSLLYYSAIAGAAQMRGIPTMMIASGLGQMRRGIDRRLALSVLERFSFAGLRTEGDILEGRGIFSCDVVSAPDLALSLPVISERKEDSFAIIPRRDSVAMLKEAEKLCRLGLTPIVIPLFMREDAASVLCYRDALGCEVLPPESIDTLRQMLARMQITLSERLHGGVFSLTSSTPFMLSGRAKKCERFVGETEKRARKLGTPSPFVEDTRKFRSYLAGCGSDFSSICRDLSAELRAALEMMISGL